MYATACATLHTPRCGSDNQHNYSSFKKNNIVMMHSIISVLYPVDSAEHRVRYLHTHLEKERDATPFNASTGEHRVEGGGV